MDGLRRRMAMHDHPLESDLTVQEHLPDPHQILRRLPLQRHARPRTGVAEEIVPDGKAELEGLKEVHFRRGQLVPQIGCHPRPCLGLVGEIRRPQTIGTQRIVAAIFAPFRTGRWLLEEAQHRLLMVTLQEAPFDIPDL